MSTKDEIRRAIEERVQGYGQALKDMDADRIRDFFADSEDFVFDEFGSPPMGHAEYMAGLDEFVQSGASFTSSNVGTIQVVVLGPAAASCSFEYSWTMVDGEGNATSAKGTWAYVFKNFDGVWKVIHSTGMHLYE